MRKMPRMPEQFTELDARALEHVAWRVWEITASDLASAYYSAYPGTKSSAKIHVVDFIDTLHSYLDQPTHLGRMIDPDTLMVARDAERADRVDEARKLRGGGLPHDAIEAFRNSRPWTVATQPEKATTWARCVVERFLRSRADKRGYLRP